MDVPLLAGHPKVVALAEERHAALGRYGDLMIRLGAVSEALPALEEAAAAQPLDEAGQARLIRAYAAAGRRAKAFATFHDTRRRLADELGVDPGQALSAAHEAVLREPGEPSPVAAPPLRFRHGRRPHNCRPMCRVSPGARRNSPPSICSSRTTTSSSPPWSPRRSPAWRASASPTPD